MKIRLCFMFVLLVFILFRSSEGSHSNIDAWCNKTPHPQSCQYFMNGKYDSFVTKKESYFHKMTMQTALHQALKTRRHAVRLAAKSQNEREKAALDDCIQLLENTMRRLKRTIKNHGRHADVDAQTWLSAALTNLETCRTGFAEMGVWSSILPIVSNVSELVTNALATNRYTIRQRKLGGRLPRRRLSAKQKLLESFKPASGPHLVVAQDGSGNFTKVQEAVDAASRRKGSSRFVIYVKAGTYHENVYIGSQARNIMMVGDGIGKTIITGSRSVKGGFTTYRSATVAVEGDRFMARDMTFCNTAGSTSGQAVALRSSSDLSVFYRCSFDGYQDTLYVHSNMQFFRDCDVYGTVDFIFGNAAAVFQNCSIYSRNSHRVNVVTAHGRINANQTTGIVIQNSKVVAFADTGTSQKPALTYLGRPWKKYSRTIFIKTFLDSSVVPAGWLAWNENSSLESLYYGEYKNTGAGSSIEYRVKWAGFHVLTNSTEASKYTVANFISGTSWLPVAGVPFSPGLRFV